VLAVNGLPAPRYLLFKLALLIKSTPTATAYFTPTPSQFIGFMKALKRRVFVVSPMATRQFRLDPHTSATAYILQA